MGSAATALPDLRRALASSYDAHELRAIARISADAALAEIEAILAAPHNRYGRVWTALEVLRDLGERGRALAPVLDHRIASGQGGELTFLALAATPGVLSRFPSLPAGLAKPPLAAAEERPAEAVGARAKLDAEGRRMVREFVERNAAR